MAIWTGTHAEIVRLHCTDDTTRQLYLLLLQRLVQLLTHVCEDVDGCGDRVARCCLQEDSLPLLVRSLQREGSVETKVGARKVVECQVSVVKFLAVLVYSVRSLETRVKVSERQSDH